MNGWLIVFAMAAATMITRFLPFLLFPAGKKTPEFVEYLGRTLPYATIGLLVVYCLKAVDITGSTHGMPELLAVVSVVGLHLWKKNSLISIGGGTAVYMVLVQMIFG